MKRMNKLAAAVAVALSLGAAPQANALITLESNGRGDTLLFPVFYGYGENYFTISNNANEWIQGHLRFRNAPWTGELLDFDVILSPGDVFVFRLADVDGDGYWEIDESLDEKNFAYTGMLMGCNPEGGKGVSKDKCIDQFTTLIPEPSGNITAELIDYARKMGYVEFIGEGTLNGMTGPIMSDLINPANAGNLSNRGQREVGNKLGTSLWSWTLLDQNSDVGPFCDATAGNGCGLTGGVNTLSTLYTASDVPNVLSGTAFLTQIGHKHGIAYNAEALVNFRTNFRTHRVSNYNVAVRTGDNGTPRDFPVGTATQQTGVILHNENAAANPSDFVYVYGYREAGTGPANTDPVANFEGRISFNNTWGPTLADGDDYNLGDVTGNAIDGVLAQENYLAKLRWTNGAPGSQDSWDVRAGGTQNSIAEVEEAIRKATPQYTAPVLSGSEQPNGSSPRQLFTSFYFDNAVFDKACQGNKREGNTTCSTGTLQSWFFAFFPTKFFYGESPSYYLPQTATGATAPQLLGRSGYLEKAVQFLLNISKPFNVQVWDIFENTPGGSQCVTSPCLTAPPQLLNLREELSVFSIKDLKNRFGGGAHQNWDAGRTVLQVLPPANVCKVADPQAVGCVDTYPGLLYTFDWGNDNYLSHWRPMQR